MEGERTEWNSGKERREEASRERKEKHAVSSSYTREGDRRKR